MAGLPNPGDRAMIRLVRLVVDDGWDAASAATALRGHVPEAVLLQVRARLARAEATTHGVGPFGERARVTVELALGHDTDQWNESA